MINNSMDEFEKWISTRKLFTKYNGHLRKTFDGGSFVDVRVNGHWITWQAATKNKEEKCL